MKTLPLALALGACLIQFISASAPVLADNAQIPKSLFSWRDSLLKRRDNLLYSVTCT